MPDTTLDRGRAAGGLLVSAATVGFLATGIPGLDTLLGGGLPAGSFTMLVGIPGCGKTVLAEQLATFRAQHGDRVIMFTALSESHDRMLASLRTFSFYDPEIIGDRLQFHSLQAFLTEGGLDAAAYAIVETARNQAATIAIIDGFRGIAGFADSSREVRTFMYNVRTKLAMLGVTTLVTHEAEPEEASIDNAVLTVADGVIVLRNELLGWRGLRTIRVQKLRTRAPLDGRHSFTITSSGVTCYPRQETVAVADHSYTLPPRAMFALPELDKMLGGGLPGGTTTLLVGSLGTGKTLLCLHYLLEGVRCGEPGLMVGFAESRAQLRQKAASFGMELATAEAQGNITVQSYTPAELDADIIAANIRAVIEQQSIRRLAIDPITGMGTAVTDPAHAHGFLAALVSYLRSHHVTTLVTDDVSQIVGADLDLSQSGMNGIADSVLLIRHLEFLGTMHRIIAVLKMRQSFYDPAIREFAIDHHGIHIREPLHSVEGVLTGLARLSGAAPPVASPAASFPADQPGGVA